MPDEIILKRSGKRPVAFEGELRVQGTTQTGEAKRWYTLKVYQSQHELVAAVEYVSTWPHEPARYDVYIADQPADLAEKLLAHDPLAHVVGYPTGKQFEEKQQALMVELRRRWGNLVTEVLACIGAAQKLE